MKQEDLISKEFIEFLVSVWHLQFFPIVRKFTILYLYLIIALFFIGKLSTVQQLVSRIEKDEENFSFDAQDDPATVAGVLKLYLRQLPFPLFPFPKSDRETFSETFDTDPEQSLASLTRRIRRLPPAHQATLRTLTEHLAKVAEHEQENKMGLLALGIVFRSVKTLYFPRSLRTIFN